MRKSPFGARRGRWLLALMGCALALVLVEGVLQAGAFVMWLSHRKPVQPALSAAPLNPQASAVHSRSVLCIGDSYTFGTGASSTEEMSYPAQLERVLNQDSTEDPPWQVSNRGWPGRNSAETRQRLPGYLAQDQPALVCILIGTNNRWNHFGVDRSVQDSQSPVQATASEAWEWKVRSVQLVALIGDALDQREAGQDDSQKEEPSRKRQRLGGFALSSAPELLLRARKAGGTLAKLVSSLQMVQREQVSAANAQIDRLMPTVLEGDSLDEHALLVLALVRTRRREEALQIGEAALEKLGGTTELHGFLIEPLYRMGRVDEAERQARLAIDKEERMEGWLYRSIADLHAWTKSWPEAALAAGQAQLLDQQSRATERIFRRVGALDPERERTLWAELEAQAESPSAVKEIREVYRAVRAEEQSEQALIDQLRGDLEEMVRCCRESGVRVLLLNYPKLKQPRYILESIAAADRLEGADKIDLAPEFRKVLRKDNHDHYFIPDGHCTDAGYEIMARAVAERLRGMVR